MTKRGGTPPVEYRFKKGESGNPKGRPRGSRKVRPSVFSIITDQKLTVRIGDMIATVSAEEALHMKTFQQAINGDKKVWAAVLDMIIAREQAVEAVNVSSVSGKVSVENPDPDNADKAMVLLGIATYQAEPSQFAGNSGTSVRNLLFEPWGVQQALQRRALTALSNTDRMFVEKSTRNARNLNWPAKFRLRSRDGQ